MRRASIIPVSCCMALLASAAPCEASGDGAYGRLDGDVTWQLDVGVAVRDGSGGAMLSASSRYLDTAGLYVTAFEPWTLDHDASDALSVGLDVRPLFLPRFLKDMERGPSWLDLFIDSTTLRLGAVLPVRRHADWLAPGLECGIQVGVPFTSHSSGPWLRVGAALEWSHAGLATRTSTDTTQTGFIALSWQGLFDGGLVDLRDRRAE